MDFFKNFVSNLINSQSQQAKDFLWKLRLSEGQATDKNPKRLTCILSTTSKLLNVQNFSKFVILVQKNKLFLKTYSCHNVYAIVIQIK